MKEPTTSLKRLLCRPISVSFLIRTSGKDSHSQASSTWWRVILLLPNIEPGLMSSLDISVEWYIENIYNQFFGRVALMRCLVSSEYLQKTDRSCDWAIKEFSAHLGKGGFSAFCLEGVFSWQDSSAERGRKRGGIWLLWALQWAMHWWDHMIPQISVSQRWSLRQNSWNTSSHCCSLEQGLFLYLYLYQYFVLYFVFVSIFCWGIWLLFARASWGPAAGRGQAPVEREPPTRTEQNPPQGISFL